MCWKSIEEQGIPVCRDGESCLLINNPSAGNDSDSDLLANAAGTSASDRPVGRILYPIQYMRSSDRLFLQSRDIGSQPAVGRVTVRVHTSVSTLSD